MDYESTVENEYDLEEGDDDDDDDDYIFELETTTDAHEGDDEDDEDHEDDEGDGDDEDIGNGDDRVPTRHFLTIPGYRLEILGYARRVRDLRRHLIKGAEPVPSAEGQKLMREGQFGSVGIPSQSPCIINHMLIRISLCAV